MVEFLTQMYCLQHQRFVVGNEEQHLIDYPDHSLIEIATTSGLYDQVLNLPGNADLIVAPDEGTSTLVISGFLTIEDALNFLVSSGVPNGMPTQEITGFDTIEKAIDFIVTSGVMGGMPTQVISGFPTIESAINFIVTSGFPEGTFTTTLSGYDTLEAAIEDLQEDKVSISGDTMEGDLILDHDPIQDLEAVTKQYVDNEISSANGVRVRNYSYSDEGKKVGLVNSSLCYRTVQVMIFEGSSILGIPSEIKAALKKKSSGTPGIRIVDVTNSEVICELTGFSESHYTIKDLGSISNISSTEVIWEIQIKKCYCAALSIKFSGNI